MQKRLVAATFMAFPVLLASLGFGATIGPLEYHSAGDSPFDLSRLGIDFFLEDFSRGIAAVPRDPSLPGGATVAAKLSTPGVYETSGRANVLPDGRLHALALYADFRTNTFVAPLSFRFDIAELGKLPQAVGFVTSNAVPVLVNFYGSDNNLVETLFAPTAPLPDPVPPLSGLERTLNFYQRFRFFGAIHTEGISRVDLLTPALTALVDDFQYGRLIPEPASIRLVVLLFLFSCIALDRGNRSPLLAALQQKRVGQRFSC